MIPPETLRRLCRARDLMRDWSEGRRTVAAVARQAGFSRYHFIRLFRVMFGETPHQYRSRAQIERAKHLLVQTDWSVTEVCMAVGCSSLGSFSARFCRRAGMSPTAFQRRHRGAAGASRQLPASVAPGCLTLMSGIFPKSAISEKPVTRGNDSVHRIQALA
jgi:AraC-like DNA-binding protein